MPPVLEPELSLLEVGLAVGGKVGAVGPVSDASSCPQNPFTMDVADAMSVWDVHPVAATEEAADIAPENLPHAHVQSPHPISQGMQPP